MSKQKKKSPKTLKKVQRLKNSIKAQVKTFPDQPGIYKMYNKEGEIIYIGKAKNIKSRVSSYFSKQAIDIKTQLMVAQIVTIEYILTDTESEALILEKQLIKKYQPKYNILLKDDKSFPYIKITNENFPKVKIVRQKKNDAATYYGPYPSLGSTRKMEQLLADLFLLRTCKQKITMHTLQPKCILLDMQKCLGPCIDKTITPAYQEQLEWVRLLLTGHHQKVKKQLIQQMRDYSVEQQYEQAAKYRDMIIKIDQLKERQTVDIKVTHPIQVWVLVESKTDYYILVQELIHGQLIRQNGYQNSKKNKVGDEFIVAQAIENDQQVQLQKPKEVIIDSKIVTCCEKVIQYYFPNVKMTQPQRGLKYTILERAKKNALFALQRISVAETEKTPQGNGLDSLKSQLKLSKMPQRIWGFDISHLSGSNIVASAVCFTDEQPNKTHYRRFNIKTVSQKSDDVRAMKEVVSRRFQQAFADQEPLPDLVLIDGGKGQLNFAYQALNELGLGPIIDILALAKKEESIFMVNNDQSIKLLKSDPGLQLLQRVRDEAHRFAVSFQRHKRAKDLFKKKK